MLLSLYLQASLRETGGSIGQLLNKSRPTPTNSVPYIIFNGAGANAPSENLGFYFGGLRQIDNSPLQYGTTADNTTTELSNTLLVVNTKDQGFGQWAVPGLPFNVRTRAQASLAWIPAGDQGMLVAIGGSLEPTDIFNFFLPWDNSSKADNNFTEEASIYDIANERWFTQAIETDDSRGWPKTLASSCVVVASHFDKSETLDKSNTHRKFCCDRCCGNCHSRLT